ncbi:uncharacterized protein LOC133495455 isoform X3 [Syngnathoides biaculeatus]|uniref:uncharacterized protein LOC133495455 isoform X3 n=1 Tax=Syngnathoides biaculeatus TaxID=300417 RepID=UPI002ADE8ECC|nr:uncharacterized protein LOC133495455 isoform X3 [Syngnathoides biaculeatus]
MEDVGHASRLTCSTTVTRNIRDIQRRRLMSAPAMPTQVSRLPKFASWSKSSSPTAARLPSGFYQPGPAGGIGAANRPAPSARRVGTVCRPADYSAKGEKDGGTTGGGGGDRVDSHDGARRNARPHTAAVEPKTSNESLPVPKTGLPVPKNRLPVSKLRLTGSKQNLNGLSGSKLRPPQWSTSSGPLSSSSPRSGCRLSPPAAGSSSTGNLATATPSRLPKSDGFRPRSLAVQRRPSPAVSTSSLGAEPGHERSSASCVPTGPGRAKKSLLPAPEANGASSELARPSLAEQTRTGVAEMSRARPETSAGTPTSTGSSPERSLEAPEPSVPGETPEDMSLSSGSSVDRTRAGQEHSDDFDDPGNGGAGEDDFGAENGVTAATQLHFLDDTFEWTNGTLAGDDRQDNLSRFCRRGGSTPSDCHEQDGSSLDLSPSDSCGSGGIYMWDEEGLEPLGGGLTRHAAGFHSDVDSDALTNVDSCDLDGDDLMLDGDFPDDASVSADGDGTSHASERWRRRRRRRLCWGTRDDRSDERTPGVDADDLAEDLGALRSQLELLRRFLLQDDGDDDDDTLTTDTLSPEDDRRSQVGSRSDAGEATLGTFARRVSRSQVEALLSEVRQLRADLSAKEGVISELTLQLVRIRGWKMFEHHQVKDLHRCKKAHIDAVATATGGGKEKTERHTQTGAAESVAWRTAWRDRTAFPPSAFLSPPWQYQRSRPYGGRPKPGIPSHLARTTTGTCPPRPGRAEPASRPPEKKRCAQRASPRPAPP